MSLRLIDYKPDYNKTSCNIAEEFYLPSMRNSIKYDRISGYFGSTIYLISWSSLKEFVEHGGKVRIICSPCISDEDNKAIGFVSSFTYKDAAKIEDFVIMDEYQRKGYGSCLFSYVIEELKKKGIHDIYLVADLEDTPKVMYAKMGFTEVGRGYQVREVFE